MALYSTQWHYTDTELTSSSERAAGAIFKVFGMTRPSSNPQHPGHKVDALPIEPQCRSRFEFAFYDLVNTVKVMSSMSFNLLPGQT